MQAVTDIPRGDVLTIDLVLKAVKEVFVYLSASSASFLIERSRGFNLDGLMAREEPVHLLLTKQAYLTTLGKDLLRHSGKLRLRR